MNTFERLWRTAGIQFVGLTIVAYLIYGDLPGIGATPDAASSAAVGALAFVLIAIAAALAYSTAAGLNDFAWTCGVLSSFPRAMLIMSSAFGLWRAKLISNALFTAGVAVVILGVLGGTTWAHEGLWAPDGAYSRFILPVLSLVWVLVVSRVLLTRAPATRAGW